MVDYIILEDFSILLHFSSFGYNHLMTSATLHIPKVNTSIELTPELTEYIVDAIENYKEARSDTLLR